MSQYKKQHYIPQFLLSNFTNEDGNFFVYDKNKDSIRKTIPKNSFTKSYFYSPIVGNEIIHLVENLLSRSECKSSSIIKKINGGDLSSINQEELLELQNFIMQLFLRLPNNRNIIDSIYETNSFSDLGYSIKNLEGDKDINVEFALSKQDIFKLFNIIFLPVSQKFQSNIFDGITYKQNGNLSYIISDNPIILKNDVKDIKNLLNLRGNLIMPLSYNTLLILSKNIFPEQINDNINFAINLLILKQSTFIACRDENYLKLLIEANKKINIEINYLTQYIFYNLNL